MKKILILFIIILSLFGCSVKHNGIIVGIKHTSLSQIPVMPLVSANVLSNDAIKYFSSDKSALRALNRGSIDISILPLEGILLKNYKNIRIIKSFIKGGYGILGNENIKSLKDLQGKTVGVLKKTEGEFLLQKTADSLKVKIKTYSSAKIMEMEFIYGKIAGMVLGLPEITDKISLKNSAVYWFSQYLSYYTYAVIAVNKNSYQTKKTEIDTLIENMIEVGNELMDSPKLFFETNEKLFGVTKTPAKEIAYRIRFIPTEFGNSFEKDFFEYLKNNNYTKLQSLKELTK